MAKGKPTDVDEPAQTRELFHSKSLAGSARAVLKDGIIQRHFPGIGSRSSWCPPYARSRGSKRRLKAPLKESFGEQVMALFWEDLNRPLPSGRVPLLALLLHECGSECTSHAPPSGKGDGHKYEKPDLHQVQGANEVFQWLGTETGRTLFKEVLTRIDDALRRGRSFSSKEEWEQELRNTMEGLIHKKQ